MLVVVGLSLAITLDSVYMQYSYRIDPKVTFAYFLFPVNSSMLEKMAHLVNINKPKK